MSKEDKKAPLYAGNAEFIENLYHAYLTNPQSLPQEWREYFVELQGQESPVPEVSQEEIRRFYKTQSRAANGSAAPHVRRDNDVARKQAAVLRLIHAYRLLGHLRAQTDPINLRGTPVVPDLDPLFHGLAEADMDTVFNTGNLYGKPEMTLREIHEMLKETYTEHIGVEFMHIADIEEKQWLQNRLESTRTNPDYPADFKLRLLDRLTAAEGLETYLHTKYAGQKRFSLEGGETTITAIDEVIQRGGTQGVKEMVIGMAHRGRLNMLVNIMGKSPKELFSEFEGHHEWKRDATGDVKYHQGYSADVETPGGIVHLALGFNPSHLEIVNPVIEGSVRNRQERRGDHDRTQVMPRAHSRRCGFAGQGVVAETFQLSQTRHYTTGGTIHLVINNQIGFTMSRSARLPFVRSTARTSPR